MSGAQHCVVMLTKIQIESRAQDVVANRGPRRGIVHATCPAAIVGCKQCSQGKGVLQGRCMLHSVDSARARPAVHHQPANIYNLLAVVAMQCSYSMADNSSSGHVYITS